MAFDKNLIPEDDLVFVQSDVERIKKNITQLDYCLENLSEYGFPIEKIKMFQDFASKICSEIGHTWESDACHYLDCIFCSVCRNRPKEDEEVNEIIIKFPNHIIKTKEGKLFQIFLHCIPAERFKHIK